jgi:hypothetical protein
MFGGFSMNKLFLGLAFYFGVNMFMTWFMAKEQTGVTVTNPETGEVVTVAGNTGEIPPFALRPKQLDEGAVYDPMPWKIAPIWPQDSHLDIIVTVSPSFNPAPISKTPSEFVVLDEKDLAMNSKNDQRSADTSFKVPKAVQNNGTLWGHFYIGLTGSKLDPKQPGFDPAAAYHFAYPLTHYLPKKKIQKTRNLLEDRPLGEQEEEPEPSGPILAGHYHPNVTLAFIPDFGVKDYKTLHPALKQFLTLEATGARDGSGKNAWYCKLALIRRCLPATLFSH